MSAPGASVGRMDDIGAIPVTYSGVLFRSTLEADWAATLDSLCIKWQYEPEGLKLPSGRLYRPDFYLPQIATWLEVKGPHSLGLDKTRELADVAGHVPDCRDRGLSPDDAGDWDDACCQLEYQLVVIGYAPVRGLAEWHLLDRWGEDPGKGMLRQCPRCGAWWWVGLGAYGCRAHRRYGYGDDDLAGEGFCPGSLAGENPESWEQCGLPFVRARGARP